MKQVEQRPVNYDYLNKRHQLSNNNKTLEFRLHKTEELYENSNLIVSSWDYRGLPIIDNIPQILTKDFKNNPQDLKGVPFIDLFDPETSNQNKIYQYINKIKDRYYQEGEFEIDEFKLKNGKYVLVSSKNYFNEDGNLFLYTNITDINDQVKVRDKLHEANYHDPLTNLYNRKHFNTHVEKLNQDRRHSSPITIFMVDMDNLKSINDICGHAQGDKHLIMTADILKNSCRETDKAFHLSGDEFAIISSTNLNQAFELKNRIIEETNKKNQDMIKNYFTKDIYIPINLSIGFDTRINSEQNLNEVLVSADTKMYQEKLKNKIDPKLSIFKSISEQLYKKDGEAQRHSNLLKNNIKTLIKIYKNEKINLADMSKIVDLFEISRSIVKHEDTVNQINNINKIHKISSLIAFNSPETKHINYQVDCLFENWDGTGPKKLIGEMIPIESRLFRIALAMTDVKYNNKNLINELNNVSNHQLDPNLTHNLIQYLKNNKKELN